MPHCKLTAPGPAASADTATKIEYIFYDDPMADTPADRLTIARLAGTARRHARRPEPGSAQHDTAITELAGIAAGRADLLAEVAAIEAGAHHGDMNEAMHLRAAQLCIDAGADTARIPHWAAEGQRRAAQARARPRR